MANGGPVCDRCGLERPHYRFCSSCKLFVCDSCWQEDAAVCLTCARPNLPGPGQVPAAIRGTIGQRSMGVSTSGTRLGQALTGPSGEPTPSTGTVSEAQSPGRSSGRSPVIGVLVVAVGASILLIAALYAGPVVSGLLAGESASSSPSALASPEGGVQGDRSTPRPTPRTYVVRTGDTLRSIALAVYGDEERWRAIYRANRRSIGDPDALIVGETLMLPAR